MPQSWRPGRQYGDRARSAPRRRVISRGSRSSTATSRPAVTASDRPADRRGCSPAGGDSPMPGRSGDQVVVASRRRPARQIGPSAGSGEPPAAIVGSAGDRDASRPSRAPTSTVRIPSDHRRERRRAPARRAMVRTWHRPVERQVLLDQACTDGRGRERQLGPVAVADQPTGTPKAAPQGGDRPQVRVSRHRPGSSRRSGRARPGDRRRRPRIHRRSDLDDVGHPGRDEQRPASRASRRQEREVGQLSGADLERRHVEPVEQLGGGARRTGSTGRPAPAPPHGRWSRGQASRRQGEPEQHLPLIAGESRGGSLVLGRRGAAAEASASGSNVWNFTASAPASAAASTSRWASAGSPLWLTPASAMTRHPPDADARPPMLNARIGRAAGQPPRRRRGPALVDVDAATRARRAARSSGRARRTGRSRRSSSGSTT